MPNGLTQEQMVERVYTELVGLDGQSGLVKEHAEDHARIDVLQRTAVTKEECAATRKSTGDRRDKVLMRVKDILLIAGMIATLLLGSGLLSRGG